MVIIKGNLDVGANCEIYELTGRKVMEHRLTDNQMNIIDLPSGIKGILFIRVTDGGNVTVKETHNSLVYRKRIINAFCFRKSAKEA